MTISGAKRALLYFCVYSSGMLAFRLISLTLVTYLLMSSGAKFQEISDTYAANELIVVGLGALLFVCMLRWLNPLTSTTTEEIFSPYRFEKRFAPGFLQGATLASALTFAFLLSDAYAYLGFFIQADSTALAIGGVVIRILAIICMVYCEEFLFHSKILNSFRSQVSELQALVFTSLLYCAIKSFQFHLGLMHLATLFLISFWLGIRSVADGDFSKSAGLWAGILVTFHALLSLPILGNETQGILLLRFKIGTDGDLGATRFLTGGSGGPLSSFILQLIILVDIGRHIFKNQKIILNRKAQQIH